MDGYCLVCNANVNISTSVNINNTSVKYSDQKLVSIVVNILGADIDIGDNSSICGRCYSLFKLYEQAQWTAKNTENEILRTYQSKISRNLSPVDTKDNLFILPNDDIVIEKGPPCEEEQEEMEQMQVLKEKDNDNTPYIMQVKPLSPTSIIKPTINKFSREKYTLKDYFENTDNITSEISNDESGYDTKKRNDPLNFVETVEVNVKQEEVPLNNFVITLPAQKINNNLSAAYSNKSMVNEIEFHDEIDTGDIQEKIEYVEYVDSIVLDENIEEVQYHTQEVEQEEEEYESDQFVEEATEKISKPTKNPELTCTSCKKECADKTELRNHRKTHSELKPHMCEICGHAYRHKRALDIHVGMHKGINPFQCSHCGKTFTQKATLLRHTLIHTGETPFQCEICGKRFTHHTSYNMHILSHTKEKNYKCTVCNLSLLSTSHLSRHMRVHTGEKPYTCPICFKHFAQRYNLYTHQKIHLKHTQKTSRCQSPKLNIA